MNASSGAREPLRAQSDFGPRDRSSFTGMSFTTLGMGPGGASVRVTFGVPVAGRRLRLRDRGARGTQFSVEIALASLAAAPDPTLDGAFVHVFNPATNPTKTRAENLRLR